MVHGAAIELWRWCAVNRTLKGDAPDCDCVQAYSRVMAESGSVGATRTQLSREDGSERGPPRSWDNFSHWVCCMCVVTFDLELGQALEVCVISIIDETYFMMPLQAHAVKRSNFISQPDNDSYTSCDWAT